MLSKETWPSCLSSFNVVQGPRRAESNYRRLNDGLDLGPFLFCLLAWQRSQRTPHWNCIFAIHFKHKRRDYFFDPDIKTVQDLKSKLNSTTLASSVPWQSPSRGGRDRVRRWLPRGSCNGHAEAASRFNMFNLNPWRPKYQHINRPNTATGP